MKYAIIKAGGLQYQVCEGQEIDDDKVLVGQPVVKDAKVKGKVIDQILGDKIRIATYKAKSRYRKVKGHRDQLTRVLIEKIEVKD